MKHPDEILRAIDQGALVAISHSGGKDSDAATIEMMRITPPEQVLLIHATLGESEWPGTLELAHARAEHYGVEFKVAQSRRSLLQMVEDRFLSRPTTPSWFSPRLRYCTSGGKRAPILKALKAHARTRGYSTVINVMGLRAEESENRAGKEACTLSTQHTLAERIFKNGNTRPGRTWYEYLPIHQFKEDEVFGTIRDAGMTPHYAYGLGNSRVSCIFCVMGCRSDLRLGAQHNTAVYRKYAELEQRCGYTFHPSRKSLPEITGISVDGEPVIVPERIRRGSVQPALF